MVFFLCLSIIPMAYAFGLAFFREDYGTFSFAGISNFMALTRDPDFLQALFNTFLYAAVTIPAGLALSLLFACMLSSGIKGSAFFRALYFTPAVTTAAAIGYIWLWIYNPRKGILNRVIERAGAEPVSFLSDPDTALLSIAAVRIWIYLGFQIVIFLAGLQAIPESLYEAAEVEGASQWQKFRSITLPLLNPYILFLAVVGTIKTLQMFTEVYIMTPNGGPLGSTRTIVFLVQQTAFESFRKGYAASMTVVLFVMIFILILLQIAFLSKKVEY